MNLIGQFTGKRGSSFFPEFSPFSLSSELSKFNKFCTQLNCFSDIIVRTLGSLGSVAIFPLKFEKITLSFAQVLK